jgi:PKD domain
MGGNPLAARGAAVRGVSVVLVALLACLLAASSAWGATADAEILEACPPPTPGHATCFALARVPAGTAAAGAKAGAKPLAQTRRAAGGGAGVTEGFTPAQLATAYAYDAAAGGGGQTVGIVDAFNDPLIESDLNEFDTHYGLAACTTANGCLKKAGQTGSGSLPPNDKEGWSTEITLDVETVHAVCPNCKILLVESNSSSFEDLAAATNEAVALGATEVSNSYGGLESFFGTTEAAAYDHRGIPIVASTGDHGYYGWDWLNQHRAGDQMPSAPASLPSVVAVGGTTLELNSNNTREQETVWNENGPFDEIGLFFNKAEGATGGGCSKLFTAQPWQQDVAGFAGTGCGTKRLDADVSAVADPETGFDIYDTDNCGPACAFAKGWVTIGGTSLSAPFISSMYALAGGGDGLRYPALAVYGLAADATSRFDVTQGGNDACGGVPEPACEGAEANKAFGEHVSCEGTTECNAAPGFDGPSGVGTPNGLGLFKPQAPTAAFSPPASLTTGVAESFSGAASSDPYPGGSIASYAWSWGDGTANSGGGSPQHTYKAPGAYSVSLTVTDSYGLTSANSTESVGVSGTPIGPPAPEQPAVGSSAGSTAGSTPGSTSPTPPAGNIGIASFQAQSAAAPSAKLASTALLASAAGAVTIKVACPAGASSCSGTVTLRTLTAVSAGVAGAAKKKAVLTLGSASFTVAGGKLRTVTLHLSSRARALLARERRLRVAATILAHDPAGASHTTRQTVTLSVARARH